MTRCRTTASSELLIQDRLEILERLRALESAAVDEERRRRGGANGGGFLDVFIHLRLRRFHIVALREFRFVETGLFGELGELVLQIVLIDFTLILEQRMVQFPKPIGA